MQIASTSWPEKLWSFRVSIAATCCSEPILKSESKIVKEALHHLSLWCGFSLSLQLLYALPRQKDPFSYGRLSIYPVMKTLVCLAQPHEVYVLPHHLLLSVFRWLVPCCGKIKVIICQIGNEIWCHLLRLLKVFVASLPFISRLYCGQSLPTT